MSVLIDTNILTRVAQPGHPMHNDALDAVGILRARGEELRVVAQNLIQFWAVATRALSANGLEMKTSEAQTELARIKSLFRLLPDSPGLFSEWEKLVVQHSVSGKNTHDARIVAAMNIHAVTQILTFSMATSSATRESLHYLRRRLSLTPSIPKMRPTYEHLATLPENYGISCIVSARWLLWRQQSMPRSASGKTARSALVAREYQSIPVIYHFKLGATPEEIGYKFTSLCLADI